jgi:FtsP/CotA-like multicopper oxidase with cupredoxin domain
MMTAHRLFRGHVAAGAAPRLIAITIAAAASTALAAQSPQAPLAPAAIPQFAQPLPTLNLACATGACAAAGGINTLLGNKAVTLKMCEFPSAVLPPGTLVAGAQPLTWTWGYLFDPTGGAKTCAELVAMYADPATGAVDTYLGPVLVNDRGGPSTDVTFVNELGSAATTNVLAYKYSTDQTLHWADPAAMQMDGMANMCMMWVEKGEFVDPVTGALQHYPPPGHPCAENYLGPIAAAPHLHGGEQPAEIDGAPDSWWTSDGSSYGHKYYTFPGAAPNAAIYRYPNTQEAAPIWFHDHTLGATRLNVYAGLAGGYYIQDPAILPPSAGGTCSADCLPQNLQPLTEVVPLILQDRMFDTNGQLFFTADSAGGLLWALNPEHPYWNPEFVGDVIVVNGKAWPTHTLERKRYRFLFLNGSNARTYEMFLTDPVTKVMGPPMWVIATDGGYLDAPVKIDPYAPKPAQTKLVIQPGERYEVIVDFADPTWLAMNPAFSGSLVLKNVAKTPFPAGATPTGGVDKMMKFVVVPATATDTSYDPATDGPLRSGANRIHRLVDPAAGALAVDPATGLPIVPDKRRLVTLNEVMGMPMTATDPVTGAATAYPGGPLEVLVNNTKWGGKAHGDERPDFTYATVNGMTTGVSEFPAEGDTEVWEIVNLTADAHPIHLHAVQFQLLNRQSFDFPKYNALYDAQFGGPAAPLPLPAAHCPAPGVYCPGYGPPLDYDPALNPLSGGKLGGNPDVTPFLKGVPKPPLPSEAGWKDTVINYPGQVTRYAVRWAPNSFAVGTPKAELRFPFDPSGGGEYNYVWHCHIIDHEDNEMMRPDYVTLNPLATAPALRELRRGSEY